MANSAFEIENPTLYSQDGGKPYRPGSFHLQSKRCPGRLTIEPGAVYSATIESIRPGACHGDHPQPHHRSCSRQDGGCTILRGDIRLEVRARRLLRAGTCE